MMQGNRRETGQTSEILASAFSVIQKCWKNQKNQKIEKKSVSWIHFEPRKTPRQEFVQQLYLFFFFFSFRIDQKKVIQWDNHRYMRMPYHKSLPEPFILFLATDNLFFPSALRHFITASARSTLPCPVVLVSQ